MRLALAAAILALSLAAGAGAQSPTLFATVGPGFTINLADAAGNKVTHLDPGTYTIQVDDKADSHDFHLTGPGVDQATGIEQVGTTTWTVTFTDGTYRYRCDPHALTMKGDFTVGTPPAPRRRQPRGRRPSSPRASRPARSPSRGPAHASASPR